MSLNVSGTGTLGDEPDAHLGTSPSRAAAHLAVGHGVYVASNELATLKAAHNAKHHRSADGKTVTTEGVFDDTIDELIGAVAALDLLHESSEHRAEEIGTMTEEHVCWGHECGDGSLGHVRPPADAKESQALAQHLTRDHGQGSRSIGLGSQMHGSHEVLHATQTRPPFDFSPAAHYDRMAQRAAVNTNAKVVASFVHKVDKNAVVKHDHLRAGLAPRTHTHEAGGRTHFHEGGKTSWL